MSKLRSTTELCFKSNLDKKSLLVPGRNASTGWASLSKLKFWHFNSNSGSSEHKNQAQENNKPQSDPKNWLVRELCYKSEQFARGAALWNSSLFCSTIHESMLQHTTAPKAAFLSRLAVSKSCTRRQVFLEGKPKVSNSTPSWERRAGTQSAIPYSWVTFT